MGDSYNLFRESVYAAVLPEGDVNQCFSMDADDDVDNVKCSKGLRIGGEMEVKGETKLYKPFSILSTDPADTTISVGYQGTNKLVSSLPAYDTHKLTINLRGHDCASFQSDYNGIMETIIHGVLTMGDYNAQRFVTSTPTYDTHKLAINVRGFDVATFQSDYNGVRNIELNGPITLGTNYEAYGTPSGNQLGAIVHGVTQNPTSGYIILTTGGASTTLSVITLPPGVWLLIGNAAIYHNGSTGVTADLYLSISGMSNNVDAASMQSMAHTLNNSVKAYINVQRIVPLTTSTNLYLNSSVQFPSDNTALSWNCDSTQLSFMAVRIA